jgi:transposase-like protein
MAKRNSSKATNTATRSRRIFAREFKEQAVQMMLDGHSAKSVSDNLGIDNTNLLYRWKQEHLEELEVSAPEGARSPKVMAAEIAELRIWRIGLADRVGG